MAMSQLIKMQGPIYRSQLEKDIEAKRQSYTAQKSDPVTGYDSAVVIKYPWGYGITQRQAHHYIGAGTEPDQIDYMCEYLGLIIDDTSVKKFELLVSGVESSVEADQWAKKVVAKIGKTTLANFRD
jgi:flavodoxin